MTRTPAEGADPKIPKLSLGDPLHAPAAENTAEAWGERVESELERRSRYEAERPPHHGD